MVKLALNSCAKLNLYLAVLDKRRDNYHNIETLFERISLSDKITLVSRRGNGIKISCSHPGVPKGSSNLCFRSAKLLKAAFNIKEGLEIKIRKRIPVGAGLGGGSADAAAVLLGLNRLWKLKLSRERLLRFAAKIGSDVPFFIYDCSFALGFGRGDKIVPLKPKPAPRLWHLLVVPDFKVSTPLIYRKWDEYHRLKTPCKPCALELTTAKLDVKILTSLRGKDASGLLFNGLEEVSGRVYPQIKRAKERLLNLGLERVLMSGSGPALFAIVPSRKAGLSLVKKISRLDKSWRVYLSSTF